MKNSRNVLIIALGCAVALFGVHFAFAQDELPAVQQQGDIRYLTGGVGSDEAKIVQSEAKKYPLSLEFLLRSGNKDEFTSAVNVEIVKGRGAPVFSATSDGPFMLIDLPPGKYKVTASSKQGKKMRTVEIQKGHHTAVTFEWPAESTP